MTVETINRERRALVGKLETLKVRGAGEADAAVLYLRAQIARVDHELLQVEVDRLRVLGCMFAGSTQREQLGADAWTLDTLEGRQP